MAQGTFDILHPGHIHYLEESSKLGDELVVVIARNSRVKERKNIFFSEDDRKKIVGSLEMVDKAVLGAEGDIYTTVEEIDPDVITLGSDQHHDEEEVKEMATEATGKEVEVTRISELEGFSSSEVKEQLDL